MNKKPFDNEERNRYYGVRVGDIVQDHFTPHLKGEVVAYGFTDNNRVHVKLENGEIKDFVAEWCDIITKVEDRKQ